VQNQFSPIVLKAIVDVVAGGSASDTAPPIGLYRSGHGIEQFMLDCNLDFRIAGGSRVPSLLNFVRNAAAEPDGYSHFIVRFRQHMLVKIAEVTRILKCIRYCSLWGADRD